MVRDPCHKAFAFLDGVPNHLKFDLWDVQDTGCTVNLFASHLLPLTGKFDPPVQGFSLNRSGAGLYAKFWGVN